MKKLLLVTLAISLAGCGSVDRQVFKARQTFDKYPNEAAKYCGDKFPVADSIISAKSDTIRGKATDYAPAFTNLKLLLDSAKEIVDQKQTKITDLAGQFNFAKTQLKKANDIVNNLSAQISAMKAGYKPCGVDTITNTYTKIRANTAKILALTAQTVQDGQEKEKTQKSLGDEKATSAHRLYWIIGLCLLIASYLGFKIYKFLSGGAIVSALVH